MASPSQDSHEPTKAEKVLTWWNTFTKAFVGISIFGASITFSIILSNFADPALPDPSKPNLEKHVPFPLETVRVFLAVSWLLFVMVLGFASVTGMLLIDPYLQDRFGHQDDVKKAMERRLKLPIFEAEMTLATGLGLLSLALEGLTIAAFLFLSLAVASYVPVVGWIGVGFISCMAAVVLYLWISMDPWE